MTLTLSADTLLNVFLAIAVDNLGNAQLLTAAEERAELAEQVIIMINNNNPRTIFIVLSSRPLKVIARVHHY